MQRSPLCESWYGELVGVLCCVVTQDQGSTRTYTTHLPSSTCMHPLEGIPSQAQIWLSCRACSRRSQGSSGKSFMIALIALNPSSLTPKLLVSCVDAPSDVPSLCYSDAKSTDLLLRCGMVTPAAQCPLLQISSGWRRPDSGLDVHACKSGIQSMSARHDGYQLTFLLRLKKKLKEDPSVLGERAEQAVLYRSS